MPRTDCTVLIAARNAAATIARAVASAAASSAAEILVVDDFSTDDTADLARAAGDTRVRILRPPQHQSLGLVRQCALDAVRTRYAVNLDADDALLPGRVERLVAAMESAGADLAADGLELYSGTSDTLIRSLPLPSFLREPHAAVRIFERNYLPGIGQVAFRTAFAHGVGYDPELHGVEDTDFFLRSVAAGARVTFVSDIGYRMYSYPGSVSRNLSLQRQMLARLLRKHSYPDVARLYRAAGYSDRVAAWGLCSMATFREEYADALESLSAALPATADRREILEPNGPLPAAEGWREGFTRGTLLCLLGRPTDALPCFETASGFDGGSLASSTTNTHASGTTPDLLNNWGVALAHTGHTAIAKEKFIGALATFPDYLDAKLNLESDRPEYLTSHPLRRQPSRHEY